MEGTCILYKLIYSLSDWVISPTVESDNFYNIETYYFKKKKKKTAKTNNYKID